MSLDVATIFLWNVFSASVLPAAKHPMIINLLTIPTYIYSVVFGGGCHCISMVVIGLRQDTPWTGRRPIARKHEPI